MIGTLEMHGKTRPQTKGMFGGLIIGSLEEGRGKMRSQRKVMLGGLIIAELGKHGTQTRNALIRHH